MTNYFTVLILLLLKFKKMKAIVEQSRIFFFAHNVQGTTIFFDYLRLSQNIIKCKLFFFRFGRARYGALSHINDVMGGCPLLHSVAKSLITLVYYLRIDYLPTLVR